MVHVPAAASETTPPPMEQTAVLAGSTVSATARPEEAVSAGLYEPPTLPCGGGVLVNVIVCGAAPTAVARSDPTSASRNKARTGHLSALIISDTPFALIGRRGQGHPHSKWFSSESRRKGLAEVVLNQPAGPPSRSRYTSGEIVSGLQRVIRSQNCARCGHDRDTATVSDQVNRHRRNRKPSGGDRRSGNPPVGRLMWSRPRGPNPRPWCPDDDRLVSRVIYRSARHRWRVRQHSSVCVLIGGNRK